MCSLGWGRETIFYHKLGKIDPVFPNPNSQTRSISWQEMRLAHKYRSSREHERECDSFVPLGLLLNGCGGLDQNPNKHFAGQPKPSCNGHGNKCRIWPCTSPTNEWLLTAWLPRLVEVFNQTNKLPSTAAESTVCTWMTWASAWLPYRACSCTSREQDVFKPVQRRDFGPVRKSTCRVDCMLPLTMFFLWHHTIIATFVCN